MTLDETALLHRYMSDGDGAKLVVDVGAHHGTDMVAFLSDGYHVLAFEPDPANRERLTAVAARYPNLHVDARAVTDRSQSGVPLFTSRVSSGISGLHRFHESHVETCRVDTVSLAEVLEAYHIEAVGFLKVDTEGYDYFVLQGYPWERMRPEIVLCEFEDRKTRDLGYTFDTIAEYLVARKYQLLVSEWHPIVEYGRQHSWCRFASYPCELADENGWGNIIAFRDGIDWLRLANAAAVSCADAQAASDRQQLRAKLQYIETSVSWRVTSPLRSCVAALKSLMNKGTEGP